MAIRYKKCFTCGTLDVQKIRYDYPTAEVFKKQEKCKTKLGGDMNSEYRPQYHCNKCGENWTADEAIHAAYNEIIGLRASVGGFFNGHYEVMIHFQDKKLRWKYRGDRNSLEKEFSDEDLAMFISGLRKVNLLNWKRRYEEPDVLDGMQWEVEMIREKRNLKRSGSNKYPAEWECFCELIRNISNEMFQ
ncbi:hypothetical protein LZ578_10680 [Jeotgalibaca sp. MA1X17-3]|uniref:hypothetical protein n=1 Tax=Jeotgalibaca sp. MA1X17-3 TaxID=2908211 RepID=UPI001F3E0232|nr:hypothetical protein [Jeotgalibaca sp. MA1X17-3]UJF15420.1 hypothetical protein LZ578_10680 [Jeotgalibaca sp. MA1X17-3]